MTEPKASRASTTRREFLKTSTVAAAGTAALNWIPNAYARASETIKVGLIGCGGRGGPEEEPGRPRRHPAPPPGQLSRGHGADPRRRHRRPGCGPGLLEPEQHLGIPAEAGLERHGIPDPQLVSLPLALRRLHRRAARP